MDITKASTRQQCDDIAAWVSRAVQDPQQSAQMMTQLARETTAAHATYITLIEPPAHPTAGPLCGVPFAVKDNIVVAGYPTTGGSEALSQLLVEPTASAVRALEARGAVVVGKANMHEFALGVTSENGAFGAVRNPRHCERSAGGSSGGTAAAVASGSVPFALGTDTGGSMTIPAAFCGVVGMRPTQCRYPNDGLVAISPTRDTIGVMANHVADVAMIDSLIASDGERGVPVTRLGVPWYGWWDSASREVRRTAEAALARLEACGFVLVDVDIGLLQERALACRHDIVGYEAPRSLQLFLTTAGAAAQSVEDLLPRIRSADVRAVFEQFISTPVSHARYKAAQHLRMILDGAFRAALVQVGVGTLVYPSTPVTAVELGAGHVLLDGGSAPLFETITRNTELASMLGHPMVSIPVPVADDVLPVGITVEGLPRRDRDLLATAGRVEAALREAVGTSDSTGHQETAE